MYYPSAAGGCQSPIDIVTEDTYVDPDQMHNGCCLYHLDVCYLSSSSHSSDQPKETNDEARTVVNTGNAVRISLTNSCSCKKLESIAAFCETQTPIKRLHNYLNVAKPVFNFHCTVNIRNKRWFMLNRYQTRNNKHKVQL